MAFGQRSYEEGGRVEKRQCFSEETREMNSFIFGECLESSFFSRKTFSGM